MKKETIKGWAVIDKKGLLYAQAAKPKAQIHIGSDGRLALEKDCQIIICSISYILSKKL